MSWASGIRMYKGGSIFKEEDSESPDIGSERFWHTEGNGKTKVP